MLDGSHTSGLNAPKGTSLGCPSQPEFTGAPVMKAIEIEKLKIEVSTIVNKSKAVV